jgi:hypothetical protein
MRSSVHNKCCFKELTLRFSAFAILGNGALVTKARNETNGLSGVPYGGTF